MNSTLLKVKSLIIKGVFEVTNSKFNKEIATLIELIFILFCGGEKVIRIVTDTFTAVSLIVCHLDGCAIKAEN
jgi:predicted transcriptional regulator